MTTRTQAPSTPKTRTYSITLHRDGFSTTQHFRRRTDALAHVTTLIRACGFAPQAPQMKPFDLKRGTIRASWIDTSPTSNAAIFFHSHKPEPNQ